jgi:hypothetical protein
MELNNGGKHRNCMRQGITREEPRIKKGNETRREEGGGRSFWEATTPDMTLQATADRV